MQMLNPPLHNVMEWCVMKWDYLVFFPDCLLVVSNKRNSLTCYWRGHLVLWSQTMKNGIGHLQAQRKYRYGVARRKHTPLPSYERLYISLIWINLWGKKYVLSDVSHCNVQHAVAWHLVTHSFARWRCCVVERYGVVPKFGTGPFRIPHRSPFVAK